MPSPTELARFPGATLTTQVKWRSIVPPGTMMKMLAPDLSSEYLVCALLNIQGNTGEEASIKVLASSATAPLPGVVFELYNDKLEVIATGVTR